jgi:hypothetical protein
MTVFYTKLKIPLFAVIAFLLFSAPALTSSFEITKKSYSEEAATPEYHWLVEQITKVTAPDKTEGFFERSVSEPFYWKRKAGEPFISYPPIAGIHYGFGQAFTPNGYDNNYDDAGLISKIDKSYALIGKAIIKGAKKHGLIADKLSTIPLQYYDYNAGKIVGNKMPSLPKKKYANLAFIGTYGFRGANKSPSAKDLYIMVVKYNGCGFQDAPYAEISLSYARPDPDWDKVYDILSFKDDPSFKIPLQVDSVAIFDVRLNNTVYGLYGSNNRMRSANYYYIQGNKATLISDDTGNPDNASLEAKVKALQNK